MHQSSSLGHLYQHLRSFSSAVSNVLSAKNFYSLYNIVRSSRRAVASCPIRLPKALPGLLIVPIARGGPLVKH
jgi:hypothetical protein